jgi:hypothetical protein
MTFLQTDNLLQTGYDEELLIVENDNDTTLEQSLIKIYRGYLLSQMAENDEQIERAELFDGFLKIQTILRECQN